MDSIVEEAALSSAQNEAGQAEGTVKTVKDEFDPSPKYEFQVSVFSDEESSGEETFEDAELASFLEELGAESDDQFEFEEALAPAPELVASNEEQAVPSADSNAPAETTEVSSQRILSIDSLIQRQRA